MAGLIEVIDLDIFPASHDIIVLPDQNINPVFKSFFHGIPDHVNAVQLLRDAFHPERIAVINRAAPFLEQVTREGYPSVLAGFFVVDVRSIGCYQGRTVGLGNNGVIDGSRDLYRAFFLFW